MSGEGLDNPKGIRIFVCIFLFGIGNTLMMCADCQKYYTLQLKKGLITNGFFKRTRNPNFLGEMMIYLSFAVATGNTIAYWILMIDWSTIFVIFMFFKEMSFRKKKGWLMY